MRSSRDKGDYGERLAQAYLRRKGYRILERNWSTRYGEIDIVAACRDALVFIEVKTRYSQDTESAFAGLSPAKHERFLKAVYQYLHERELGDEAQWRIDVIGISLDSRRAPIIDHIEDAFDW